jgi:hypothetical protein
MPYNDLSTCNCCPVISPCICNMYAVPCCFSFSGYTHCSFAPSGSLCKNTLVHSINGLITSCLWLSEATWVIVEPAAGSSSYFPRHSRLLWALRLSTTGSYSLLLCLASFSPTTGEPASVSLLELARWLPSSGWDPMFDTSSHAFTFDRLLAQASNFPSVINCDYPSGCGTSVVADGSNLPQTINVTPSCFISTDACQAACLQSITSDESGCGNCSSDNFCSDGMLPANCSWEWNSGSGLWEVTSDDCSNSPDSGCGCVPMLTGCDTDDPGTPSLTTGPCYDAASHSEGVRVCDP